MHQNSEVNGKTSPQSQKNLRYFKFDFMCFFSAQWHPKNLASNLSQLIRAVFEVCRQRFRRPQQISYKSFILVRKYFFYIIDDMIQKCRSQYYRMNKCRDSTLITGHYYIYVGGGDKVMEFSAMKKTPLKIIIFHKISFVFHPQMISHF